MLKKRNRDWFTILRDLIAAGISMREVARRCGRTVSTVVHWGEGGEPKDSDARTVMELYKRHCREKWEKHMREFDPDELEMRPVVYVAPDKAIRGRPRPRKVAVTPSRQDVLDFFFQGEAA
jgi:hypothetical protein